MNSNNSLILDNYFDIIESNSKTQKCVKPHELKEIDIRVLNIFKKTGKAMYARTVYHRLLQEYDAEGKEVTLSTKSVGQELSNLYIIGEISRESRAAFLYFLDED